MTAAHDLADQIHAAVSPHGLSIRGLVAFSGDGPVLPSGGTAGLVVLIGHKGGQHWPSFRAWQETRDDRGGDHPLDQWSKAVIAPIAETMGGTAYFPSDPPWQPFQAWAMQAEGLKASPLGILIHPEYGLWHGYRGAIGFAGTFDGPVSEPKEHPCDVCTGKPCITACPAGAITLAGFGYKACRSHIFAQPRGQGCLAHGCLSRDACPVGRQYRYSDDQIGFHMAALAPLRD